MIVEYVFQAESAVRPGIKPLILLTKPKLLKSYVINETLLQQSQSINRHSNAICARAGI